MDNKNKGEFHFKPSFFSNMLNAYSCHKIPSSSCNHITLIIFVLLL